MIITLLIIPHINIYKNFTTAFSQIKSITIRSNLDISSLFSKKTYNNMDGKIHVVVIGESHSKQYWSLYGYHRKTTPKIEHILNNTEYSAFIKNAFSCDKMTATVLASALTEKNQYNSRRLPFSQSFSIINILNKAGFETYWVSNQAISGFEKESYNIIAQDAKYKFIVPFENNKFADDRPLDGEILKIIKKIPFNKNKEHVIFIHLMGNHAPYAYRYTKEYNIYHTEKNKNSINAYDNATIYSDTIISSLYEYFSKLELSDFIYFSDHGELPGIGRDKFDIRMFEIPVFAIFKNEKNNIKLHKINNFIQHSQSMPFSNDCIYDTLIGLYGINTQHYNKKCDFTSENYEIKNFSDVRIMDQLYGINENGEVIRVYFTPEMGKEYYCHTDSFGCASLTSGWSASESWGTWSNGNNAQISFQVGEQLPTQITLDLNVFLAGGVPQQRMQFRINGHLLPEIVLNKTQEKVILDITDAVQRGLNQLTIHLPNAVSPCEVGLSNDNRKLAIGIKIIKFD